MRCNGTTHWYVILTRILTIKLQFDVMNEYVRDCTYMKEISCSNMLYNMLEYWYEIFESSTEVDFLEITYLLIYKFQYEIGFKLVM